MRRFIHWLAHRIGWPLGGEVVSAWQKGDLWLGFRCGGCGEVHGAFISKHGPRPDPWEAQRAYWEAEDAS